MSTVRESYSIHDPPGYIKPSLQDFLLTDIPPEELRVAIAHRLGVEYLSPAASFPGSFPVQGKLHGLNNRLMINLACRKEGSDSQPINVIFAIVTGSPVSYLSAEAMEALAGKPGCKVGRIIDVMIHSDTVIECHLSPHDKHFASVNVLGMDFLSENKLSLSMDYVKASF